MSQYVEKGKLPIITVGSLFSHLNSEKQNRLLTIGLAWGGLVLLVAASGVLWWRFGYALWPALILWLVCFGLSTILSVLLCQADVSQGFRWKGGVSSSIRDLQPLYIMVLSLVGFWSLFAVALLGVIGILNRLWTLGKDPSYITYYIFLLFYVTRIRTLAFQGKYPWLLIGTALCVIPLLAGWIVASLSWNLWDSRGAIKQLVSQSRNHLLVPKTSHCPDSSNTDETVRVAVALSGGGYRAAVIHAGVLAALDVNCVPLHILTTVSGGSIVGATYVLGVPPMQFANSLAKEKPGLPIDLLSIFSLIPDLAFAEKNLSDSYREHFRRVFFGDIKLGDLPESPLLLVNTTDMEAERLAPREVLVKGRQVKGQNFDQHTLVADIVTASGAFPGPFQPVRLKWPKADRTTDPVSWIINGERKFTDGGALENLGVEGLRHYLTLPRSDTSRELPSKPSLLLISDASGHGSPEMLQPKVDVVSLLSLSADLSRELLHSQLYSLYTGQPQPFEWIKKVSVPEQVSIIPYGAIDERLKVDTPENLVTVVMPITAFVTEDVLKRFPNCRYKNKNGEFLDAHTVHQRVRTLETLKELDPGEIDEAFWLGYALGTIYQPAIQCALLKIRGRQCDKTAEGQYHNAQVTCPSLDDLQRRSVKSYP